MRSFLAFVALFALLACFQNSAATSGINKHVIGGDYAVKGQFPWQVLVFLKMPSGYESYCSGTIISSTWILTAAHCRNDSYMHLPSRAFLGGILYSGEDAQEHQYHFSARITHEGYNAAYDISFHDLMLIQLATPFRFSANVKPVRLPRRSQPPLEAGTQLLSAGFGGTHKVDTPNDPSFSPSTHLKYLEFELRDDWNCTQFLELCSQLYTDRSMYFGDSGAGWVWKDPSGINRLVGVETAGKDRDYFSFDAVNVHTHLAWIERNTGVFIEE